MAGKKNSGGRGGFLGGLSFFLIVLVLIAALGGVYFLHVRQNTMEEEKLEAIIASEKSPQITGAKVLSEQIFGEEEEEEFVAADPEEEVKEEPAKVEPTPVLQEVSPSNEAWQAAMPVSEGGETASPAGENVPVEETPSQQTTETTVDEGAKDSAPAVPDVKTSSILIINGTYKNGVAAYWEGKFREAGFTNLLTGSYSGKAEQVTAIYGVNKEMAESFREFFPTAEIRDGSVPDGYTMADETTQPPASCDFYIVVGIVDAVNS